MNTTTLLLQSGGRDSAAAAISLLEAGNKVLGITLSANAANKIELPQQRAIELSRQYKNYGWMMVDFTDWDVEFKLGVSKQLSAELPKSCLLCALSKITAVIPYCHKNGIKKLAMGYTEYQSSWAEQTPEAIRLQTEYLNRHGIEFILPSMRYKAKQDVERDLIAKELSSNSLENPCCISDTGTQDVSGLLIQEAIEKGFEYFSSKNPCFEIVASIGMDREAA